MLLRIRVAARISCNLCSGWWPYVDRHQPLPPHRAQRSKASAWVSPAGLQHRYSKAAPAASAPAQNNLCEQKQSKRPPSGSPRCQQTQSVGRFGGKNEWVKDRRVTAYMALYTALQQQHPLQKQQPHVTLAVETAMPTMRRWQRSSDRRQQRRPHGQLSASSNQSRHSSIGQQQQPQRLRWLQQGSS